MGETTQGGSKKRHNITFHNIFNIMNHHCNLTSKIDRHQKAFIFYLRHPYVANADHDATLGLTLSITCPLPKMSTFLKSFVLNGTYEQVRRFVKK